MVLREKPRRTNTLKAQNKSEAFRNRTASSNQGDLEMKAKLFAAAITLGLGTPLWAEQTTLVVNSWGGPYEKLHRELVFEPFEKAHDVKIQVVTLYSADALAQLRAQKEAPQYDVIHFSGGQEVIAAREGLLAPIEPAELENAPDLYPFASEGMTRGEGPVHLVTTVGLLYNEETAPRVPTSWKDLWDAEYGDHIVLTDLSNSFGLLGFLMMNRVWGGAIEDATAGLEKVGELVENSMIVTTSPEIQQNFAQNDAWITPFAQDYAHVIRESGLPVKFVVPEEGVAGVYFTANLVANRPNQDLAKKLIDFELSPEVQEAFARAMRYSPSNSKAVLDDDIADEILHGDAMSSLVRFDPLEMDAHRNQLVEDWKKLISR